MIQWKIDSNDELPLGIIEDTTLGYGIVDFPDYEFSQEREKYRQIAQTICDAHNHGPIDE